MTSLATRPHYQDESSCIYNFEFHDYTIRFRVENVKVTIEDI